MNQKRAIFLAGILAASEASGGPRAESLSMAETSGVPSDPDVILDRTQAQLNALAESTGTDLQDPADARGYDSAGAPARESALKLLLGHAEPALRKLKDGDFALSTDELFAMEAIIIADGSRPSFVLQESRVSDSDPFIGNWRDSLTACRSEIQRIASAVGRIQPQGGNASNYIGSGTLIDATKKLVLTNFHVIDQARKMHRILMHEDGNRIIVKGVLEIDFAAESGALDKRRFRIAEIRLPADAGAVFAGVDAAVCRLEPLDEAAILPEAITPLSASPAYATGEVTSLALIGFPGEPARDRRDQVDWAFVVSELFGKRFGIKRLSPGRFRHGLGTHPDDRGGRAIGHDATTFGGASGAVVVAWLDDGAPGFALHFGGETAEANYALSFAKAREALEPLGVPFG